MSGVFLAATPLPAAIPLFAIGLGGLGLLGWPQEAEDAKDYLDAGSPGTTSLKFHSFLD